MWMNPSPEPHHGRSGRAKFFARRRRFARADAGGSFERLARAFGKITYEAWRATSMRDSKASSSPFDSALVETRIGAVRPHCISKSSWQAGDQSRI